MCARVNRTIARPRTPPGSIAAAGYLLSKITKRRHVIVDRMIEASGHGKDKADGAGAVFKGWCRKRMAMSHAFHHKNLIRAATMVNGAKGSLAVEIARVAREEGFTDVKPEGGEAMRAKRVAAARTDQRIIDEYEEAEVTLANSFKKFNDSIIEKCLQTEEERKGKLPHRGWRDYHHVCTDVTLPHDDREGFVMMRRWPCGCAPCRTQSEAPTFAERFRPNSACARSPMFGSLNQWKKVRLVPMPEGDGDEDEDGDDDADGLLAMASATQQMTSGIVASDYIGFETSDDSTLPAAAKLTGVGFYVVQGSDVPYPLQEGTDLSDEKYEMVRKMELKPGELVIDAEYMNPVWGPNAKRQWYTKMEGLRRFVVVPARAVVHASFEMADAALSGGRKDKQAVDAIAKGAVVLAKDDREIIMEALRARDHANEA
jgi:hypothetical protein